MTSRTSLSLLALTALASPSLAQNDECTGAFPIGLTPTVYDTTMATLSPELWPCATGGGPDLWFAFTAPNDAAYTFDTCGSSYDSAIELFTGTCGALTSVACNDDYCGVQSSVTWSLTAGSVAYLRVGGYAGTTGVGTINVTETVIPGPSGSVTSWLSAVGSGTPAIYTNSLLPGPIIDDIGTPTGATSVSYEFVVYGDNGGTSSGLLGNIGSGVGSSASLKFEQWSNTFMYGVTQYGVADHIFPGGVNTELQDIHLVYVADIVNNTTELFVNGVSFGTTPFAPLLQGLQGIGQVYRANGNHIDRMWLGRVRGVAVYDAALSLAEIVAHHDAYFSGTLGTLYCSPAVANSTGAPGAMSASGTVVAAANNLTIACEDLPNNSFGFFLTSRTQGAVGQPGGSQGVLCLSGSIGRYVGPGQIKNTGTTGAFDLALNLTQTPTPTGLVSVLAGDTWNFQAWYRDSVGGVATSNFTNGLSVLFQ
ncbi:MAG: hypothetical protein R3F49_10420 [Planctomycetota bacterium]